MSYPIVDDPVAWCVADALRECFCAELAAVSAPVGCCCLYPGQQVAVDSCDPGMAWVRVARIYPLSDRWPQQDTGALPHICGGNGGWAVTLELGVMRCLPGVSESGALPSCEQVSEVARLTLADAHAMRRAIECCDWRQVCGLDDAQILRGAWEPIGPEGLCVGGVMAITVQVRACVCDPEPVPGAAR